MEQNNKGHFKKTTWTPTNILRLKVLSKQLAVNQISTAMNLTIKAVIVAGQRYNIKLKKNFVWTEEEIELLKERAKTMSCVELAKFYQKTHQNMSHHCQKFGIPISMEYIRNKTKEELQKEKIEYLKNLHKNNIICKRWHK